MNKVNCIIVDDEPEAADRLASLLRSFDFLNILGKENSPETAIKAIVRLKPQLLFMDIEMPRSNGFDVVKEIRAQNVNPTFIFVTGYNQYAIKAIRNQALDNLLKPVDIDELEEALQRFLHKQKASKGIPHSFIIKYALTGREVEIIRLLMENNSSRQISEKLYISRHTVDTHRRKILQKTGFNSTAELYPALVRH